MMEIDVKKVKIKIKKIQETVEKQGRYGFYMIDGDNVKLVSKDHDKTIAEEEFYNKIADKTRYVGNIVYFVDLNIDEKYIEKKNKLVTGPVSLKVKVYKIAKNYKLKKVPNLDGAIWYSNKDIADGRFHFTDIKNLIHEVYDKKINIISVGGITAVDILEGNY